MDKEYIELILGGGYPAVIMILLVVILFLFKQYKHEQSKKEEAHKKREELSKEYNEKYLYLLQNLTETITKTDVFMQTLATVLATNTQKLDKSLNVQQEVSMKVDQILNKGEK